MGYDAMANDASLPVNIKELGKKKRANRSAKLKQCKLDARREQWLAQVKNKDCKVTPVPVSPTSPPLRCPPVSLPRAGSVGDVEAMRDRDHEREGPGRLHDSDSESPTRSSIENKQALRKGCPKNDHSSGSSTGSYSRGTSDTEEDGLGDPSEENGPLDDWEAVADALTADDDENGNNQDAPTSDPVLAAGEASATAPVPSDASSGTGKPELQRIVHRAWRPDDAFRPQSLPNLSKQQSFPTSMERRCGAMGWAHHALLSEPSSCPICYEDLDLTDSSFLPCSCGFRLCLFCHKKILEADGRCPGCRKKYDPVVAGDVDIGGKELPLMLLRLSRSCSMSSRS